jgi:anti-sigma regulatory factor (Ser/Thr protein kinase)
VDEWVTNVVVHGYRGAHGPVEVEVGRDGSSIVVRVRDRAPVFDPADAPGFDPSVPLERRRLGGMGIHLMRELMDSVEHRPLPGSGNEVTMRRGGASARSGGNA